MKKNKKNKSLQHNSIMKIHEDKMSEFSEINKKKKIK